MVVNGKKLLKYKRQTQMMAPDDLIENLEEDGLRGPDRRGGDDYYSSASSKKRYYQNSSSYYEYARDLCKHYKVDFDLIRLCVSEKRYIGITKKDFERV